MPNNASQEDLDALRQELRDLRKDLEQQRTELEGRSNEQRTELEGRLNVIEERTNNVRNILYAVLITLLTSVAASVIVRTISNGS